MEDLNLTETEMRYFGDLFLCCDEESNGKIPILKATELFRSSNIPNDVLKQLMDLCVAPHVCASLNHLNRKQFYSCLKMIAAHQQNLALTPELLESSLDLSLPRFTWALNSEASPDLIQLSSSPKEDDHIGKRKRNFAGNHGTYEPIRLASNLSDSDVTHTTSHDTMEGVSTDSEIESETMSQRSDCSRSRRGKNGSPWSTASESPTPTNSVAERPHPVWEHSATGRGVWPVNTGEEHTQLLGTEEECSDRHSSEEEGSCAEVWAISSAQARHYAAQFAQLRPTAGLLPGQVARLFFEKSRLSVTDLRKIWLLAAITSDGALSLAEFSVAMHLIVLRRNNVPVPDELPSCLKHKINSRLSQQAVTTDLVDLGSDMFSSGTSADFNFKPDTDHYEAKKPDDPPATSPPKEANKEWTKFVDSPTSSVSSPGPKPVNFDFHKSAVERDPKIYHPVALRATPDANTLEDARSSTSPRRDEFSHAFELSSPKRLNSQPPAEPPPNGSGSEIEIKPIQRPQPKKPLKTAGVLPPPPAREPSLQADDVVSSSGRKEPPPPPPPRPLRQHARSSSLDLNRYKGTAPAAAPAAPAAAPAAPPPPPRADPAFPPADDGHGDAPKMHGAFEVYRKPSRESSCEAEPDIKSLQEQNAVLHRVCRALCSELADAQREREALRAKLEDKSTAV